jgi:hypothetical protein
MGHPGAEVSHFLAVTTSSVRPLFPYVPIMTGNGFFSPSMPEKFLATQKNFWR